MRDESGTRQSVAVADRGARPSEIKGVPVRRRRRVLDRIRATTAGRVTLKVVVAIVGVGMVLLGLLMIPLPGPGWLVVFTGLAVLSLEYVWAKHLLRFGRTKVMAWSHWAARQTVVLRVLMGSAGLACLAAIAWLALSSDAGAELVRQVWRFLTSN